jgi:hypothetical protein
MKFRKSRAFFVRVISLALVSAGFAQISFAGVVGTDYMLEAEARNASLARVESLIAREDVAQQLQAFGVDQAIVQERLQGLTQAELITLESQFNQQIAGGDALGVIGAVFLVLLILELVGVTDIFKSF